MITRWMLLNFVFFGALSCQSAMVVDQPVPQSTSTGPAQAAKPGPKPSTPAAAAQAVKPDPKQLEFWVGEWDVTDNGKTIGASSIQWIADGHGILENYSQPGFSGKSLTFIDGVLGKWRQTWVDSQGRVSEFTGEYKGGAIHFEGETHNPDGNTSLRRMVLQPVKPDGVRHFSERSTDDGKTWAKIYDYVYTKKK